MRQVETERVRNLTALARFGSLFAQVDGRLSGPNYLSHDCDVEIWALGGRRVGAFPGAVIRLTSPDLEPDGAERAAVGLDLRSPVA